MAGPGDRDAVHQAMETALSQGVFPGAVLVWGRPDKIVFHRAYGTADLSTGEPVRMDTVFDLASLTKPLATTLAVAELVGEKQLAVTTALGDILYEAAGTDKAGLTVDMLLRHTSGLPAYREYFKQIDPSSRDPRGYLRRMVLAEPLEASPGARELYSDLGFILLAWVVERISGLRLDRLVQQSVYDPLGIEGLYFPGRGGGGNSCGLSGETPAGAGEGGVAATSRCAWRGRLIKGEVEDENAWAVGGVEGHAGLFGDGASVFRLCSRILKAAMGRCDGGLDSRVIGQFFKKRPPLDRVAGFDTPAKEHSSAGRFFSHRAVGHLGFTGTSMWMDPADGLIVVLLTNRVHPTRENLKIRQFRPLIHDLIHQWISARQ